MTNRRRVSALVLMVGVRLSIAVSAQYQGWFIPIGGKDGKNPLAADAGAIAKGRALFQSDCARCHGPEGRGNGADSDHASDLMDNLRTELNPDGVLFYKIWNGHAIQLRTQVDDMPAFDGKLTSDEVWALVEHLKVLRSPAR